MRSPMLLAASAILLMVLPLFAQETASSPDVPGLHNAIRVRFDMDKNDQVTFKAVRLITSGWDRYLDDTGDYQVLLLDSSGNVVSGIRFRPSFVLLSDPPEPLEVSSQSFRLPYKGTEAKLVIKRNDTVLFWKVLPPAGTCNFDGVCWEGENMYGCYQDCGGNPASEIATPEYRLEAPKGAGTFEALIPAALVAAPLAFLVLLAVLGVAYVILKARRRGKGRKPGKKPK